MVGRLVENAVHSAQQHRQRLVVERDDDAGGRQVRAGVVGQREADGRARVGHVAVDGRQVAAGDVDVVARVGRAPLTGDQATPRRVDAGATPPARLVHRHCDAARRTAQPAIHALLKKGKGSPYSITERTVPELIPVLGSQPAGDVSHKPDGRLPLLSERGLLRYQFCCLVNRGTVGVNRPLPDSVATAI